MTAVAPRLSLAPPTDEAFGEDDYLPATTLERLTNNLIERTGRFGHLRHVRLSVLWKKKGGTNKGVPRLGQTKKAAPLERLWGETDFVIWLAADHLRDLGEREVEAALFHELLHIGVDEEGEAKLVDHDFSGFRGEVEDYGAWNEGLRLARAVFAQLPLPGGIG